MWLLVKRNKFLQPLVASAEGPFTPLLYFFFFKVSNFKCHYICITKFGHPIREINLSHYAKHLYIWTLNRNRNFPCSSSPHKSYTDISLFILTEVWIFALLLPCLYLEQMISVQVCRPGKPNQGLGNLHLLPSSRLQSPSVVRKNEFIIENIVKSNQSSKISHLRCNTNM